MTNEKSTQYNKRNYTHRIITISLTLVICLCSYIPCLANTKVEIQANSGTNGNPFHGYSINTQVADSYIDNGAMFFSNAWNSLATNIAKTGSTVSRLRYLLENTIANKIDTITTNQTSINTNITSLQGLVSTVNNTLGYVRGDLSGIRQDIQSIYTLENNLQWNTFTTGQFVDASLNPITTQTDVDPPYDYYFRFNFASNNNIGVIKIDLPIFSHGRIARNFDFAFYDITDGGIVSLLDLKYIYVYNVNRRNLELYITNFSYNYSNMLIRVLADGRYRVYPNNTIQSYYMSSNSEDYIKVSNFMYLNSINNKLDNINTTPFDDTDIINAINNLSLVDNDVKIDVNVNTTDADTVETIIPFIRSFFDNNVTLSQFTGEASSIQNGWFSQQNQDIMNNLSGGYIDLYD